MPALQPSVLSSAPTLFIQPRVPEDSDTSSDSDYEHYDFSSQPPVALTTFYSECWAGSRGLEPAEGHCLCPRGFHKTSLLLPCTDSEWYKSTAFNVPFDPGDWSIHRNVSCAVSGWTRSQNPHQALHIHLRMLETVQTLRVQVRHNSGEASHTHHPQTTSRSGMPSLLQCCASSLLLVILSENRTREDGTCLRVQLMLGRQTRPENPAPLWIYWERAKNSYTPQIYLYPTC